MNNPLISLIVVTLNRREDVAEAIDSLRQQTYGNTEIIVVDNGSNDGSQAMIKEHYSEVRLVELGQNTGPYHGRNVGVGISRGDIIFFMDDDATLEKSSIANIVERFSKEEALGVIVSKLVNANSGEMDPRLRSYVTADLDNEHYMGDMVAEGATAMRKNVFEQVGCWPAHYFRQAVGRDLSYRIIDAGYNILYLPLATVYHKESPIGGTTRETIEREKMYYLVRNQLWITWKYLPVYRAVLESIVKVCYHFGDSLRKGALIPYARGVAAALFTLPRIILKERRPVSKKTLAKIDYLGYGGVITQAEMLETFHPLSLRTIFWRKLLALVGKLTPRKSRAPLP